MPRRKGSLGKTPRKGLGAYGRVNKHIFSNVSAMPVISRKVLQAYKHKRKLAGASADYNITLQFRPDAMLTNPIEKVKKDLEQFMAVNLGFHIRDRVVYRKEGPDYKELGPFYNTGGMWRGYDVRKKQGSTTAEFYKSSYSTGIIIGTLRDNRGITMKEMKDKFRKRRAASLATAKQLGIKVRGWDPNVRNRWKAWTCQKNRKVDILAPQPSEQKAMIEYLEAILRLRTMVGDVSNVPKTQRTRRARRLIEALGHIKAPRIVE